MPMASLYKRGTKLWARLKDERGKWISKPTPYHVGDEESAQRYADEAQRILDRKRKAAAGGTHTVEGYGEAWLAKRDGKVASWADDAGRLRNHVFPVIGTMRVQDVRTRHLIDLFEKLRTADEPLAPRTIYNIRGVLHTLFKSAVRAEVITENPVAALDRTDMPKKADRDPTWRQEAIYTRDELEQLISDGRILPDRRVVYGLKGLAALRHGEVRRLRWRDYEPSLEPLGCLYLGITKTGVPRKVPVHPVLAAILAEWKLSGWERTFGRLPKRDDLIVPTRNMTERKPNEAQEALIYDLQMLGLRTTAGVTELARRGHDLRRTMITLAREDGADRDVLKAITHGPSREILDVYTSWTWAHLCAQVAKLRVTLRPDESEGACYILATAEERARKRWRKDATLTGFENGLPTVRRRS